MRKYLKVTVVREWSRNGSTIKLVFSREGELLVCFPKQTTKAKIWNATKDVALGNPLDQVRWVGEDPRTRRGQLVTKELAGELDSAIKSVAEDVRHQVFQAFRDKMIARDAIEKAGDFPSRRRSEATERERNAEDRLIELEQSNPEFYEEESPIPESCRNN